MTKLQFTNDEFSQWLWREAKRVSQGTVWSADEIVSIMINLHHRGASRDEILELLPVIVKWASAGMRDAAQVVGHIWEHYRFPKVSP